MITLKIDNDERTYEDQAQYLRHVAKQLEEGYTKGQDWETEGEEETECETCGGTGEVSAMEAVYPGEPHMADVGSRPCPDCKHKEEDYDGGE